MVLTSPFVQARCNHTATHLLQAALKQVIGDEISQAGSLVDFERLRFDFNAPEAPTPAQLARVEKLVNGAYSSMIDMLCSNNF